MSFFNKKENDIDALKNKGLALSKLGRYEEAIECYEKVLAIDGNDIFALNNKGSALFDWLQMGLIVKSN
jgi:tetratricopeptide (TPR) repeat protein